MRGGEQLTIGAVLLLVVLAVSTALRCDRTPEGQVAPKIPADNRFQLKISGSPEKYVPGEGYTISLQGLRNHGQVAQKFTGFMLVVESQSNMPLRVLTARDVTERAVGTFQLYGDTLTKFSLTCPNMVTHTSSMPKSEIQVRWTAPPPGSGCVIFRATVIEHRDVWYQDDGPLSKMLCEEQQESLDSQPEILENCCACDEAKYEVTFEGLWSRHTHPKDFPSNSWLTRFSDVIGASHSTHYRFWEYGGVASDGLQQVAERGSTRLLETELKGQSQNIRTIIKARGISFPNVTGKTFAVFRVDKVHHLMSLVSMIDPSPDWIVGVSALELCLRNCSWIESKVLNLYPWDAGTDSGITYISPDQQTYPRDKIRRITSSFPNDPRSPFYDSSGSEMKPLARLYLTRQRLYEKICEDEPLVTNNECAMTEWSEWSQCSASCGPGWKHRQRHYRYKSHDKRNCRYRLTDKKSCVISRCRFQAAPTQELYDSNCEVKQWADWSRCIPLDETCTRGNQKRYRTVRPYDSNKRKYCLSIPHEEERECRPSMSPSVCPKNSRGRVSYKDPQSSTCCAEDQNAGPVINEYGEPDEDEGRDPTEENNKSTNNEVNESDVYKEYDDVEDEEGGYEENVENYDEVSEEPTGECAMTKWSEWSPCSVSCGVGETKRFRSLLNPLEEGLEPRAEHRRFRRNEDSDYGTYDEDIEPGGGVYAEGPCSIYKIEEVMPCNGTHGETCQFSPEDSRASEENEEDHTTTEETPGEDLEPRNQLIAEGTERPVRDCKFSRWSEWSKCEAPCNQHGYKIRTRYIQVHARNGGKDCNGKTRKQRKCFRKCKSHEENEDEEGGRGNEEENERNNSRCEYSDWSEWTECTSTCGYNAMRQRTRQVVTGNIAECTDRIRTKKCNVGPCPQ